MDIEKICRTCLALSGPLLSIFDGSSGGGSNNGSGCVADMLRDFTRMKPKPMDNMPEKVCLTCISEINRCYSFKMKCENANKTLLQLLPNAIEAEELELEQAKAKQQPELKHKEVQTMPEKPKQMLSKPVQTINVSQVQQMNQEVQTETSSNDAATSPLCSKMKKPEKPTIIKVETTVDSAALPLSSKFKNPDKPTIIKVERNVDLGEYEFTRSNSTKEEAKNIKKLKFKQMESDDTQVHNDGDVIYELQSESGNDNYSSDYEIDNMNQSEQGETTEATAAYYVLSDSQQDEEYLGNIEYECEGNNMPQCSNEHEQEAMHSQKNDYNFTIIQTEEGREEITETTQSQEIHLQSKMCISVGKPEVKCKVCTMPFVSIKNLLEHCIKMHQWTETETNNMQCSLQQERQQQNSAGEEQSLDIVLDENMHASILQELQAEVVVEKVQEDKVKFEQIKIDQKVVQPIKTEFSMYSVYCPRCNAGFAFMKALKYHLKQDQCTAVTYTCDICQRVFTTEHGMEEHRESHLLQHACNDCNLIFNDNAELCQHLIKTHNRSDKNQCHICNKVFTIASALKDHLRIHSGEKPFKCTVCDKAFRQNSNLRQHLMRHSQIKPFDCDTCSLAFVSKAELSSHRRTHTGDHPFRCEYCEACYTTSSSLAKHRRTHTGERPYACEHCPMRFSALNVLKNHRRTHTGEKPFACSFCNKCFSQKTDCQIHQRTHTGEKRYTCMCGNSFTHLSTLRLHQKVHEGEDSGWEPPKKRRRAPPRSVKNGVQLKIKEQLEIDEDSNVMQHNEDEMVVVNDATADDEFMALAMNDVV